MNKQIFQILSIIFFSGNGHDYMNLALKDGGVSLTVQLGTGKLDTAIKPGTVRFDDNAWHHVLVVRKSSEVFFYILNSLKWKFCTWIAKHK